MERVSELVWLYVKQRPFLKEVLREGIVNYSALARRISTDVFGDRKRQNAVKMALIRLTGRAGRAEDDMERRVLSVLRKSSMLVKNKVAVVFTSRELDDAKHLSHVKSGRHMIYIMDQREAEKLPKGKFRVEWNLNLVIIESPEEIEEVPGVMSYLLGALASEGINVVEFISCYTDTLLVVRQAETEKTYKVLSTIMG